MPGATPIISHLPVGEIVDRLGGVKAAIADLQSREKALRDELLSRSVPQVEGAQFGATINPLCPLDPRYQGREGGDGRGLVGCPLPTVAGHHHQCRAADQRSRGSRHSGRNVREGGSMEMKPDPILQERLAGSIEVAIALRCLHIYLEARRTAEEAGGEVSALPVANYEQVGNRYQEIIDEWLGEAPTSAQAARAFLDLALVIMCDSDSPKVRSLRHHPRRREGPRTRLPGLCGRALTWTTAKLRIISTKEPKR